MNLNLTINFDSGKLEKKTDNNPDDRKMRAIGYKLLLYCCFINIHDEHQFIVDFVVIWHYPPKSRFFVKGFIY